MKRLILAAALFPTLALGQIKPEEMIDYSNLAFYPQRWEKKGHEMKMVPWLGKNIAFLTTTKDFDHKAMTDFIAKLDLGWSTYADLTGKKPVMSREVAGRSPIAAIPGSGLTCGFGCGYVGHSGIETNGFYTSIYKDVKKDPKATPHIYFYEMGRNFFTFGNKHSCFTTGFAVFMRYVCIEKLELTDKDTGTRKVIDQAIDDYAKSDLTFLKTFTNSHGLSEKQNRLKARPTDQPVMYASAMLKLHKELGDDWLKEFFRNLDQAPGVDGRTEAGARTQALSWYLAASLAAKKDLAPIFVTQWRLPLTAEESSVLGKIDWKDKSLKVSDLIKKFS